MSRFFPHAEYTEDQPLSHTILTTHVLARGFLAGSIVGLGIASSTHLIALAQARSYSPTTPAPPPPSAQASPSQPKPLPSNNIRNGKPLPPNSPLTRPLSLRLLRSSGYGGLVGTLFLATGLAYQMYGREHIEWQDRAWRLLENKGQVEVDDWMGLGAVAGLGATLVRGPGRYGGMGALGWRGVVGGAGIGGLVGMLGYLGYRHGWKGGKWEGDE